MGQRRSRDRARADIVATTGGRRGPWRENYSLSSPSVTTSGGGSWEGPLLRDLLPRIELQPDESPFLGLRASRFLSMHIEPSIYLPAVLQDYRIAGGRVVLREFADARAITALSEPIIVNCTGLASGKLFDDPDVMPIKG